jgi:hypothetical protein
MNRVNLQVFLLNYHFVVPHSNQWKLKVRIIQAGCSPSFIQLFGYRLWVNKKYLPIPLSSRQHFW